MSNDQSKLWIQVTARLRSAMSIGVLMDKNNAAFQTLFFLP